MAVLPIRTFPDPFLKSPTKVVESMTPSVLRLVDDMIETMRQHPRCVGLAAPQVGSSLRIAVADATGHPSASVNHGLMVLVNPQITAYETPVVQREGCLSVPHLTGNVRRAHRVHVKAMDHTGQRWERWIEGFEAIVIQHEVDHLDGKLFLDRVANVKTDVFRRKVYATPERPTDT